MSMSKAGDAKSRELIQTVSQISNGLMNEVSKVIIGKQENLRRRQDYPGSLRSAQSPGKQTLLCVPVLSRRRKRERGGV